MMTLDEALERLSKALAERDEARSKLNAVKQIIMAYLLRGEGGGGRSICLRISQALEAE